MSVSPEDRQRLRKLMPADGTYISFLEYRRLAINLAPALLADLEAAETEVARLREELADKQLTINVLESELEEKP